MSSYVVCTSCGARFQPATEGPDALNALEAWVSDHKLTCPKGPAAFKLNHSPR